MTPSIWMMAFWPIYSHWCLNSARVIRSCRKGLVAILNRIPGTMVIKEFDAAPPLLDYMENHHSGFLVLSQSIFDNVTELFLPNSRLLEKTIVRLVAMGLTNKQIAGELFLSAHTVITHRKNISSKLGIKSLSGLTIYAIVNNIITIEEVTSKPDQ